MRTHTLKTGVNGKGLETSNVRRLKKTVADLCKKEPPRELILEKIINQLPV